MNLLTGIPTLITGVTERFGHIDILVNNAGINLKKDFTEVTDEEFQKIQITNVASVFAVSREVVKSILGKKNPGFIVTDMSAQAFNDDPERKKKVLARTLSAILEFPLI